MKKVFAIIMSAMMLVCFVPAMAFADDTTEFIANKAEAEREWNSVGKFKVELQTPAYSDSEKNINLEGATAYAEVYEDYSVYAKLDNDKVNGHSVQATVAMRNVESLGCADQTKTHSVGPFVAGLNAEFSLTQYFPNIMKFKAAKIAGSVNGKEFSYQISDFALTEGTTERVLTATPDSTENVRAAWKELTKQVTTTSYDSDDSMVVIPAGAYLQIGTQKLTFDKPYTINPSENGVGNLEGGIRTAASLDENAAALEDGANVALYVPKDSVLRVGQSEAKLNHALLITSDVDTTNMTVDLKKLRDDKSDEEGTVSVQLIKDIFAFVDGAFGCFSGTTDKSIDVLSEYVVKYGDQEIKVFHGKTFTLPAAASGYKWVDADNNTVNAGEITVTSDMVLKQVEVGGSTGGGGGFYVPTVQKPEITIIGSGKADLSADGRTATITAAAGHELVSVVLNGKEMGKVEKLTGLKTGDKATITFRAKTDGKVEMDKMIAQKASKLTLMARSKKTAKLNIKVVVKGDLKAITDAGYTVKYKFYRSTKKSAGYKAMLTKKAPTYFNTYGKKGTMYYYKARVMIYDKDGNFVAQTALKQCKYANRLWTK